MNKPIKSTKVGRWLEERKRAKKVEHIGELKHKSHKMDVLNRIKKSVTNVLPGNPLSRDFDIKEQVGSAGPGLLWRVYSAVKKSTKESASVFLFEKKMIDRHNKRDKELIVDALRKGVQQLTKLRHPKILSVINPLEENRETLAFATEPVFASLGNVLGAYDNMSGSTKLLADFQLFEVEIKHGLLQVLEALSFLHNDVKMLHRNICPTSIILAKSGTWKLAGFEFSQMAQDPQDQNPSYSCLEWNPDQPRETQPHLDFMAPEYEIMKLCSPTSDMFSFGVLLFSLYNKGRPLYECQGELSTFRKRAEDLSSLRGSVSNSIPAELVENVKLLLNMEQAIRPDAMQMAKVPFFEDMACMTLQYVDTLFQRDNIEKSNFFKGLPKIIERLPKRVNQQRILPTLFKEGLNSTMVPFILPSVFLIAEQSTDDEYKQIILPDIIPYFKIKEPVQVMLMLLQNMNLLLSKTPTPQIQAYVLPLIFSALESESPQIQELCLNIIPTFADLIEYSTLKSSLIPRIKILCLGTTVLNVRVNCLLCMGKLMDQMDKWYVLDEILPFLREIPTREPAVLMSILGIHKIAFSEAKLGITKDVMANKVLPFLIPLCIDNNLNLQQFNAYMGVVKEMMAKVENEHRTKLEQLDQIQSEHKTIEITQILGNYENGGDGGTSKPSMMDQFMASFGLGQSSSSLKNAPSGKEKKPCEKEKPVVVAGPDSNGKNPVAPPKKVGLSIEEKQRLAKQQEQERELKAKQPLNAQRPSSSSASNKPTTTTNPSGPRDLTKTLMDSNMRSMASSNLQNKTGPAGGMNNFGMMGSGTPPAVGNLAMNSSASSGINWQSGNGSNSSLGVNPSMNWGSSSSSKTYSNYATPRSSPASSDSSLSTSSKSNMDMSSFDSLLSTSTFPSGQKTGQSNMGMGMKPQQHHQQQQQQHQQQQQQHQQQQQQHQPSMMMQQPMMMQNPQPTQFQQQPQQFTGMSPMNSFGRSSVMSSGGMGMQGGMPGSAGQWGNTGFSGQPLGNQVGMSPRFPMANQNSGGMMTMNPQNGSNRAKPLSNDDLKDFLG